MRRGIDTTRKDAFVSKNNLSFNIATYIIEKLTTTNLIHYSREFAALIKPLQVISRGLVPKYAAQILVANEFHGLTFECPDLPVPTTPNTSFPVHVGNDSYDASGGYSFTNMSGASLGNNLYNLSAAAYNSRYFEFKNKSKLGNILLQKFIWCIAEQQTAICNCILLSEKILICFSCVMSDYSCL